MLVFEDVHDADSATAALLTFLARSLRETGAVLIATYRTDVYRLRPQMAGLLADLERQRTTERLELLPFRRPEVVAQLRAILGYEVARSDMQQIYDRGGYCYRVEVGGGTRCGRCRLHSAARPRLHSLALCFLTPPSRGSGPRHRAREPRPRDRESTGQCGRFARLSRRLCRTATGRPSRRDRRRAPC